MAEQKRKPAAETGSVNRGTRSSSKKSTAAGKSKSASKSLAELEKLAAKKRLRDEIWSIILVALGVFLVVALQTEAAGQFGGAIQTFLLGCFGFVAYILPYYLIVYGVLLFTKHMTHIGARSVVCLLIIFFMFTILNSGRFISSEGTEAISLKFFVQAYESGTQLKSGGVLGMAAGLLLVKAVGKVGLYIFSLLVIAVSALLVVNTPMSQFFGGWKERRLAALVRREEEEAAAEAVQAERGARPAESDRNQDREPPEAARKIDSDRRSSRTEHSKNGSGVPGGGLFSGFGRFGARQSSAYANKELEGLSPGQRKILDYMKDDSLFETSEPKGSGFGLEDPVLPVPGRGLDGTPVKGNAPDSSPVESEELSWDIPDEFEAAFAEPEHVRVSLDPIGDLPLTAEPEVFGSPEVPEEFEEVFECEESRSERKQILQDEGSEKLETATATIEPKKENQPVGELKIAGSGKTPTPYRTPPIDLLNKVAADKNLGEQAVLQAKAMKLEETLHNFGVNAKVIQVTKGPAVTRYEIQPSTGVKVSSIVRLADDIALNLEAKSIRMEAPIPGKAAVGIEVENDRVSMVSIREIVDSSEFKTAKSKISFAVGKDIAGNAIVADLKSMPHLLIAGSTGSGKSVCINSLIISILYKAKPEEVKLVLIDPKVVELSNYNGIPHLLIPVVTEAGKAAAALNWAVAEMTDRYKKFAEEGVRDLAGYNEAMKAKGEDDRFMPQVVIIIDELADLMMAAPSQVEESICRLAQMARAAGMHLIVATQRPSVDIITGVIKANIPSRIAFAVSSQFDSRTILDMAGAEKLVGKGDMLFNPQGMGKPLRVQGCFISDSEVHKVIEFLKQNGPGAEYASDVLHTIDKAQSENGGGGEEDGDELLAEAIETVVRAEQASVSMLQRRFRIGYNRAARLVDMMEARGIIGPADGSRPRKVLMSLEELEAMNRGESEAEEGAEN